MNAAERETFYDTEIAPTLKALSEKCHANGLSLVALCEWSPQEYGRTVSLSGEQSLALEIANWAGQAGNNVDSLIMAIMKYGRKHGHSSACLHILGVDTKPETPRHTPDTAG